jgi:hypothetical protein
MAVFSRPEGYRGYRRPGAAFRAQARIRELSNEKQVRLLEKWLGKREQAQSVCESLHLRPGLRDACRVPLILSESMGSPSPFAPAIRWADEVARRLRPGDDFTITLREHKVEVTQAGRTRIRALAGALGVDLDQLPVAITSTVHP